MRNVGEGEAGEMPLESSSVRVAQVHDEQVEDEDTFETFQPSLASSPHAPSRQERTEHNVTHCPFRSRCSHFWAGKAKSLLHY